MCIYVGEECVVDLYSKEHGPDQKYCIMSSSKVVSSIIMGIAADKAWLDLDDPICTYWPEFAQNGKEKITVADLLRHEAGLPNFSQQLTPEDLLTENIKKNKVGAIIEKEFPKWGAEGTRMYHTLTRGWIENEIFRRVHPKGYTMSEYLREEFNPEFDTDLLCGLKDEEITDKVDGYGAIGTIRTLKDLYWGPDYGSPIGMQFNELVLGPIGKMMKDQEAKTDALFTGNRSEKIVEMKFDGPAPKDKLDMFNI